MLTLAIDSSGNTGVLALARDSEILCEHHFHSRMTLLRRIVPNIERMLTDAGHEIAEVGGIAVGLGPGSFTGLRIGVTVAKSIAYSLSKPIVGVSTLDVIARGAAPSGMDLICPMIHARTGEVYWTLFDATGEERLAGYEVGPIDGALESARARGARVLFCGTGALKNAEEIRREFGNTALVASAYSAFPRGAALVDIGARRLSSGAVDDPFTLTPLYIKKPTPVVKLESGEFERDRH